MTEDDTEFVMNIVQFNHARLIVMEEKMKMKRINKEDLRHMIKATKIDLSNLIKVFKGELKIPGKEKECTTL